MLDVSKGMGMFLAVCYIATVNRYVDWESPQVVNFFCKSFFKIKKYISIVFGMINALVH